MTRAPANGPGRLAHLRACHVAAPTAYISSGGGTTSSQRDQGKRRLDRFAALNRTHRMLWTTIAGPQTRGSPTSARASVSDSRSATAPRAPPATSSETQYASRKPPAWNAAKPRLSLAANRPSPRLMGRIQSTAHPRNSPYGNRRPMQRDLGGTGPNRLWTGQILWLAAKAGRNCASRSPSRPSETTAPEARTPTVRTGGSQPCAACSMDRKRSGQASTRASCPARLGHTSRIDLNAVEAIDRLGDPIRLQRAPSVLCHMRRPRPTAARPDDGQLRAKRLVEAPA